MCSLSLLVQDEANAKVTADTPNMEPTRRPGAALRMASDTDMDYKAMVHILLFLSLRSVACPNLRCDTHRLTRKHSLLGIRPAATVRVRLYRTCPPVQCHSTKSPSVPRIAPCQGVNKRAGACCPPAARIAPEVLPPEVAQVAQPPPQPGFGEGDGAALAPVLAETIRCRVSTPQHCCSPVRPSHATHRVSQPSH